VRFTFHGVAVACVGVADHGDGHGAADVAALVEHLAVGDEAHIRQTEPRGGHREATHEGERKAGPLDQPRRQAIEATRHDAQPGRREQRTQVIGGCRRHG
jgi:hypothetical protein